MPTYAQLQTESWWGREVVTAEMDWLGDELCRRTGRPAAAFGVKGDNRHLRGAHRSQEWIEKSRYCTSRTYTTQSGLTAAQKRHLAGVDFNPGPTSQMIAQSKRIIAAMKAGQLDEVREFFGTTDGRTVDGWNNAGNRRATADDSHLWHWHMTLDRRHCADRPLMERILAVALGDPVEEDDMTPDQEYVQHVINYRVEGLRAGRETITVPAQGGRKAFTEPNHLAIRLREIDDKLDALAATPPGSVTVTDEQLERVLRKVIGSVDGVTQQG